MLGSTALADVDLKSMSFDELIALQTKISAELTTRPEWKEVTVPPGCYQIGVDIPAGYWTITGTKTYFSSIHYGKELNDTKTDIDTSNYKNWIWGGVVDGKDESTSIEITEGNWLVIISKPVIFTPYSKPSLGF